MSEIVFINEQGSDNFSFLGALNEEDQKTYNDQLSEENKDYDKITNKDERN